MTNAETLGSLRTSLEATVDKTFTTSSFVTIAQANIWLNRGLMRIHYLLAKSGEDYFRSSSTINLVNGTQAYALPADFYRANGVDVTVGGNTSRIGRYMVQERNRRDNDASEWGGDYEYRINGGFIEFIPIPGSGTVTLRYVPQFTKLAADGDAVLGVIPQGLEQYAVYDAAVSVRQRERADPSDLMADRDMLWQELTDYAEPRDQESSRRIVDLSGRLWREDPWGR